MQLNKNVIFIFYSKIFSLPFFGKMAYKFQTRLLKKRLINYAFASSKESKELVKFFSFINKNYCLVICKSYKFSRSLRFFDDVLLDQKNINYKKLKLAQLHRLYWTLVYAKFVTSETKKVLKGFITENFSTKDIVIIPMHHDLNLICDYILQTTNELDKYGYIVILVYFPGSRWLLKMRDDRIDSRILSNNLYRKNTQVYLYYPTRCLPLKLHKFDFFASVDSLIFIYLVSLIFRIYFSKPYIWSFDHRDFRLIKNCKKHALTLYDCVDYWSILNDKSQNKIRVNEKKLIKAVDKFFVNSFTLRNLHKKIRIPNRVVPQGFDLNSYKKNGKFTQFDKKEIKNLKNIINRIPHPRIGYIGNINSRLDYKILLPLIENLTDVSFILTDSKEITTGDKNKPELKSYTRKLFSFPNTYLIPKVNSKRVVKEVVKNFDIGIIPYDTSYDFNRYCYPMKVFEYFYLGKPVISTDIEELKRFPKFVKIGRTPADWDKIIRKLLSEKWPNKFKIEQKTLAENNSWKNKVNMIITNLKH